MFHGDPHAGNLFLTDENRLAILDWSLVGSLGERDVMAIVQILLACDRARCRTNRGHYWKALSERPAN